MSSTTLVIKFANISKNFGSTKALKKISFKIKKGEIVGLLGPNGAGKTTAMRIMLGLLSPSKGKLTINKLNIKNKALEIKEKIGYLPENNPLYEDFKVWEYLKFVSDIRKVDFVKSLKKVADDCGLKNVLSKKIDHLSRGYKQRVGLAAALIGNPEILVLDEPTVGLDPNQIVEIRRLIKKLSRKKTVILSTHILSEVQAVCQKAIIIHKGKIVASESIKKLTKGKSLEKTFQRLTKE